LNFNIPEEFVFRKNKLTLN